MSPHQDVYARVTDKIISDLENGVRPWARPWNASHSEGRITLPLRHNGTPYRGINILLLWATAIENGYTSDRWMTFRQAVELGGHVRKGERGSLVVFANTLHTTETNEKGEDVEREIPYLKGYTVFNVEQIDGLPVSDRENSEPTGGLEKLELNARAEMFFARTGADFRHGGNLAFYAPGQDYIQLPLQETFRDAESYAATKAHELTHWTAHPSRLARTLGKRFGNEAYAAEELIAEIGAAFLCARLGIVPETREDHAAYLACWLNVLKADNRAIFTAASHAQKACDFLLSFDGNEAVHTA